LTMPYRTTSEKNIDIYSETFFLLNEFTGCTYGKRF